MNESLKQGDIFLVDFDPSVGHEYRKERPSVIIQSDIKLQKSNLITVMPLTSRVENKQSDDIFVRKDYKNRLFSNSVIKVHSITSFDKSRFIKKIGEINKDTMREIKQYLKEHFQL
jgi:mRNA interferase MazF